jgi:hypothetical protein
VKTANLAAAMTMDLHHQLPLVQRSTPISTTQHNAGADWSDNLCVGQRPDSVESGRFIHTLGNVPSGG